MASGALLEASCLASFPPILLLLQWPLVTLASFSSLETASMCSPQELILFLLLPLPGTLSPRHPHDLLSYSIRSVCEGLPMLSCLCPLSLTLTVHSTGQPSCTVRTSPLRQDCSLIIVAYPASIEMQWVYEMLSNDLFNEKLFRSALRDVEEGWLSWADLSAENMYPTA